MHSQLICGPIGSTSGSSKDQGYRQTRQPSRLAFLSSEVAKRVIEGYGANDCSGSRVTKTRQLGEAFLRDKSG